MGPVVMPQIAQALDIDRAADEKHRDDDPAHSQGAIDQESRVNSRRHRRCRHNDRSIEAKADRSACNLKHINNSTSKARP